MSESFREQLSRIKQMADGDETWDLSDNDSAALRAVLESHQRLYLALKQLVEHEQIDGVGHRYEFDYNSPYGKAARAAVEKAEGR